MSVQELEYALSRVPLDEARRLRQLLDSRLATEGDGASAEPPQPSAHDLAKDLIGSIDGPRDLARNKAYLADLGRRSLS